MLIFICEDILNKELKKHNIPSDLGTTLQNHKTTEATVGRKRDSNTGAFL